MSVELTLLLAAVGLSNQPAPGPWVLFAQGRSASLARVADALSQCRIAANVERMRGSALFQHPEDIGGELSLRLDTVTPAARHCLRRRADVLRRRYPDVRYLPDTI